MGAVKATGVGWHALGECNFASELGADAHVKHGLVNCAVDEALQGRRRKASNTISNQDLALTRALVPRNSVV
jgi:hypothetical protein